MMKEPREVVDVLFLEVFRVRTDVSLNNLMELKLSLPTTGGLD